MCLSDVRVYHFIVVANLINKSHAEMEIKIEN